ncbi:MAG: hypothetical protein QMC89_05305 [Candidatus Hodarchaeaceae archaeon]|nr:hypothetical protein [Candidatus Hodarchaeaceae archaeon]
MEEIMGDIENWVGFAAAVATLLMIVSTVSPTRAQEEPVGFGISPAEFTVRDAPPMGEPYMLERKLVVRNGDSIKRTFIISALPPPTENLREGYGPIPNENWVVLIPQVIEVGENSSGTVDIYLNIPRQENLTSQRWEVWISVRRLAEIGEVLEPELICRAKIETTAELPPPPPLLPVPAIVALVIGIAVAALAFGAWTRYRGRARGRARGRVFP